jgi:hypothetical protein
LAGYTYVHVTTTRLGFRRQIVLQVGLLLLPILLLPFGIPSSPAGSLAPNANPTGWVLWLLAGVVGFPLFVVSTSAPLLQHWFARSGHLSASDPYFLYGASNLGSTAALLAYPLLFEPNLRISEQSAAWAAGYGLCVAPFFLCASVVWRGAPEANSTPDHTAARTTIRIRAGQYLAWVVLSFVPSSLMLGVTTYMMTDISAIPLLWVVPLALYLLTLILSFARRPPVSHSIVVRAFPMATVVLVLVMNTTSGTAPLLIPVHLATFFLAAMVCHGELVVPSIVAAATTSPSSSPPIRSRRRSPPPRSRPCLADAATPPPVAGTLAWRFSPGGEDRDSITTKNTVLATLSAVHSFIPGGPTFLVFRSCRCPQFSVRASPL